MKVVILHPQVPFKTGGAEMLAESLRDEIKKRGHQCEIVYFPFKWYPWKSLLKSMLEVRMMDLSETDGEKIDTVICLKFPSYFIKHHHKVVWLAHQFRQAYDMWMWSGKTIGLRLARKIIYYLDNRILDRAFTISKNVSRRLKYFNKKNSLVLYPPPIGKFRCEEDKGYIFYPSRINRTKRQDLLIEAARYTNRQIIICGDGDDIYLKELEQKIKDYKLKNVTFLGKVSEKQKLELYANCRAVYFGPIDEDYGYVTPEAMLSKKPVITLIDSGGSLEFVKDGINGFVVEPNPIKIAEAINNLSKPKAEMMGIKAYKSVMNKFNWDFILENLL